VTEPLGLYVHLPFCHRICPYCSFYKHTPGATDFTAFIDALLVEARHWSAKLNHPAIRTAYFGGGTPSLLSEKHLVHLFEGLRDSLNFTQIEEIDFEANPSTFKASKARLFRELGISRVSLGIQSFQEQELKALGRDHTPAQAKESFQLLREAGISSCNLDLMFSVPHQTEKSWADNLSHALALNPDHISCYNLTYEEDTAYFDRFQKGELSDDPDLNEKLFTLADKTLTEAGFHHYETSNYGKLSHFSKHNLSYWEGSSYLGLGPSAVSTLNSRDQKSFATRWQNTPDTAAYISQINSVGHALKETEHLSEEQYNLERIALLLRTETGLPLKHLVQNDALTMLIENGLAKLSADHLILTRKGALLVDAIAEEIAPAAKS
jgi:oxygen-independent coproporphyrinogen-3 oxidase